MIPRDAAGSLIPPDRRPNTLGVRHSEDLPGFDRIRRVWTNLRNLAGGDMSKRRPVKEYQRYGNTVGVSRAGERYPFATSVQGGRGHGRNAAASNNQGGMQGVYPFTWSMIEQVDVPAPRGQMIGAGIRPIKYTHASMQARPVTWQTGTLRGDQIYQRKADRTVEDRSLNMGPMPMRIPMPVMRAVRGLAGPQDISGYGVWAAPMPGTKSGTLVLRPMDISYGRFRGVKAISGVLAPGITSNDFSHVPGVFTPSQVG